MHYFGYLNPSFLAKYLCECNQAKNKEIPSFVNNSLIGLKKQC